MVKFQVFWSRWLIAAAVVVGICNGAQTEYVQSGNLTCSLNDWHRNKSGLDSVLWKVGAVPSYAVNWATHQGTTADLHMGSFGEGLQQSGGPSGESIHTADWAATDVVYETSVTAEKQVELFESNACAPNRMCLHYTEVVYVFNSMTL